jgi:glycosyltransferase involved in cell wall biosynthesis
MPVYNEAPLIEKAIENVKRAVVPENITKEIIIVDDGSTDGTAQILRKYEADPEIKIFFSDNNRGKTEAIRSGLRRSGGEIFLIQDADLEYNPDDYQALLEPFIKGGACVVYGSRFRGVIKNMPLLNRIANQISNLTLRLLFNYRLSDVHTCYKLFRKDVLAGIEITSQKFTFDTEITAKLLKKHLSICEVPIRYVARSRQEGKKIGYLEALHVWWGIIKYRFVD